MSKQGEIEKLKMKDLKSRKIEEMFYLLNTSLEILSLETFSTKYLVEIISTSSTKFF